MKNKPIIAICILAGFFALDAYAQESGLERARRHFAEMEAKALQEPFRGVSGSEGVRKGLFPIKATGVSTQAMVKAAREFLDALDSRQKARTTFPVTDSEWRKWSNVDNGIYQRQGVSLKELSSEQRKRAMDLMDQCLSVKGFQQSRAIMRSEHTLKELNNGAAHLDEELYFFTIMGDPSPTEPWGWQLDGHHLVLNFFILGDQLVMAPVFMGAEPVIATSGKYKGNEVLQLEQDRGLAFMQALTAEQQKQATLSNSKGRHNAKAQANQDNLVLDYEGVRASSFSPEQKTRFLELIETYIGNMNEGHAEVKMSDVRQHLDDTWFAWIGTTTGDAVFYYRIHSPVVLIEFDHQGPIGLHNVPRNRATRNHIHTVIRTPNGNDYGKDLLRQHLESHHH